VINKTYKYDGIGVKNFRANKVVLAASSDLFYELFSKNDPKIITKVRF